MGVVCSGKGGRLQRQDAELAGQQCAARRPAGHRRSCGAARVVRRRRRGVESDRAEPGGARRQSRPARDRRHNQGRGVTAFLIPHPFTSELLLQLCVADAQVPDHLQHCLVIFDHGSSTANSV